ncbi:MAG: hypothetical protein WCS89_04655 [Candidatus Paceibacterota bacterium]|jgi:hypothetical protein
MISWSSKRKLLYATIAGVIVVGGIGVPAFLVFYKAPTCFDGIQNGGEQGLDCGGRCSLLCQSSFTSPNVAWTRLEKVAPELYNVATYIINPNTEGEAKNVPYHMSLYDKDGILIIDQASTITLPPHRNTLAFQGAVNVGKRIPTKVSFEFTSVPNWYKKIDTLSPIVVGNKDYREDSTGSSLQVSLKNNSLETIGRISVFVVLYNKENDAIGFSKTTLDQIPPQSTEVAPFTWNINRNGEVISIEVLYVAE